MHGDTLCTDDAGYQAFAKVHKPRCRRYLALPLFVRNALRANAREQQEANSSKSLAIMDVNQNAVSRGGKHQVQWLIHGHAHARRCMNLRQSAPARGTRRHGMFTVKVTRMTLSYFFRFKNPQLADFTATQPFSLPLFVISCPLKPRVAHHRSLRRMSSRNNRRVSPSMGSKATGLPCFAAEIFEILNVPHHVEVVCHHPDKRSASPKALKRTVIR